MAKWEVEIQWLAVATVRVEAATQHEAERIALDRGLPWDDAAEGGDGSQTTATATVYEDDGEPICPTCQEPIRPDEWSVEIDGREYHNDRGADCAPEGSISHGPMCPSRVGGECLCEAARA